MFEFLCNDAPAVPVDPLSEGASGACVSGKVGTCFPGNKIPVSRFDRIAGLTYNRIFGATLINEARMGLSRTVHRESGFQSGHQNVNASAGATITATRSPRLLQFGLRIQF